MFARIAASKFVPVIVRVVPIVAIVGVKLLMVGALDAATVKDVALVADPNEVVTAIVPVVAPVGTVTVSFVVVAVTTVAATPLKVTVLLPGVALNPMPWIVTVRPTGPLLGARLIAECRGLRAVEQRTAPLGQSNISPDLVNQVPARVRVSAAVGGPQRTAAHVPGSYSRVGLFVGRFKRNSIDRRVWDLSFTIRASMRIGDRRLHRMIGGMFLAGGMLVWFIVAPEMLSRRSWPSGRGLDVGMLLVISAAAVVVGWRLLKRIK